MGLCVGPICVQLACAATNAAFDVAMANKPAIKDDLTGWLDISCSTAAMTVKHTCIRPLPAAVLCSGLPAMKQSHTNKLLHSVLTGPFTQRQLSSPTFVRNCLFGLCHDLRQPLLAKSILEPGEPLLDGFCLHFKVSLTLQTVCMADSAVPALCNQFCCVVFLICR